MLTSTADIAYKTNCIYILGEHMRHILFMCIVVVSSHNLFIFYNIDVY